MQAARCKARVTPSPVLARVERVSLIQEIQVGVQLVATGLKEIIIMLRLVRHSVQRTFGQSYT